MKLFEESKIAKLRFKNRLWRSATWLGMADTNGYVTNAVKERYKRLAEGGIGSIIVEFTNILEEEKTYPGILSISTDKHICGLKELSDIIHANGANAFIQVGYGGSTTSLAADERVILGPSAVENPNSGITPLEMTEKDIQRVSKAMEQAALRAQQAGFDGVQIHAAHGYLFSQFLSPYFNKRKDNYGGSINNRGRIIIESLKRMKAATGYNYPVLIKMHCDDEWGLNGLTVADSLCFAKELEKHGIDGIEFSGGNIDPRSGHMASKPKLHKPEQQSYFKEQVTEIAAQLHVPVILVGGNRSVRLMETILNNSNISYFALSRTLHAEPDLPCQWKSNPEHQPRCISCNKCWSEGGNICILDRKK